MAISASAVFEVQTTGDDTNNSGAYNPSRAGAGTDYSLLSPLAFSDLVLATTTTATSAAIGFTSAHIGNHLRIVSGTGFTAGLYEITAVSGGTATLDRAAGTAGSTGGTGRLGGALASPGQASAPIVAGNTVWIQAGTYLIGGGTANTAGNRVNTSLATSWFGYGTTRGDDAARPRLEANASSIALFTITGANTARVASLEAYRNPAGGLTSVQGFNLGGVTMFARNLRAESLNNTGINISSNGTLLDSLAIGCTGSTGGIATGPSSLLHGCVSLSGGGFYGSGQANGRFVRCSAINCTTAGFNVSGAGSQGSTFLDCLAYGCSSHGFDLVAHIIATNCLAASCGTAGTVYGFNTAGFGPILRSCAGWNNRSGDINTTANLQVNSGFVALAANPFTNAAGLDFTPNNTAGGGALLRAAGWPATLLGLAGTSYPDIGAYQHAAVAGGVPLIGGGLVR